jgi:hypothetical protein
MVILATAAVQFVEDVTVTIVLLTSLGDPERLPKEVVLKRAADLAEALYAMPRGGLGSRSEGYNYTQLAGLPHDSHYATAGEAVEDYNRQNSSPRYTLHLPPRYTPHLPPRYIVCIVQTSPANHVNMHSCY